jgi:hypothetical protein
MFTTSSTDEADPLLGLELAFLLLLQRLGVSTLLGLELAVLLRLVRRLGVSIVSIYRLGMPLPLLLEALFPILLYRC